MEQPLLSERAQAALTVVNSSPNGGTSRSRIDVQSSNYIAGRLMIVSFVLSIQFNKDQKIQIWPSLWWEICAAFVVGGTIILCCTIPMCCGGGLRNNRVAHILYSIFSTVLICTLACKWFPEHFLPFWSSFWPWLTWPMQIWSAIHSGNFKETIEPVWRPVLWGVAQAIKLLLPGLSQFVGPCRLMMASRRTMPSQRADIITTLAAVAIVAVMVYAFPPFWIFPWVYTGPFAQIWLLYMVDCTEQIYAWSTSGGSPPGWEVWVFVCSAIVSHLITFWNMYATSHVSMSSMLGVPLDADGFFKDLLQKGGFKAKLERSNSKLLRQVSSKIFHDSVSESADLKTKREKLKKECLGGQGVQPSPFYPLGPIDREHILTSSFHHLRTTSVAQLLASHIMVSFKSESGVDAGGVTKDWFDSFARALGEGSDVPQGDLESSRDADGESLMARTTDRTLMPRPSGYTELQIYSGNDNEEMAEAQAAPKNIQERWEKLAIIGRVVGAAVLRGQPLPLSFGNVLMRFLCEEEISFHDVRHLDPDFYQYRVKPLLEAGGLETMNAALGEPLTFMSAATDLVRKPVPLVPGGEQEEVTERNKFYYIQKLSEARLCNGRRRELSFFIGGFHSVIPVSCLRSAGISPNELSVLISGVETYDVVAWKASSTAPADKQVVDWFWEVLSGFDEETKAKVLQFVTGSSRLPASGFEGLSPRFKIVVSGEPHLLPISHTCACQIDIPEYESKADLEAKLLLSLQNAVGFGAA